jgi:predicted phosphodiesterase
MVKKFLPNLLPRGKGLLIVEAGFFLLFVFSLCAGCSLPEYYDDYDSRFSWRSEFRFFSPDSFPALEEEFSFLVVSDPHISGKESQEAFEKLARKIGDAEFIIITGDVTQEGSYAELGLFIEAAGKMGIPCYPVAGNHDIYTDRGKPWRELVGSTMYRLDSASGNTTLFILDNANASFGNEQLEWFEAELLTAEKHVFVFFHEAVPKLQFLEQLP